MTITPDDPTAALPGRRPVVDLATWLTARDELLVREKAHTREGCTTTAWHLKDAVYLNARGVSFAILATGRWDEVASYVEFMGYGQPWYSVRDVEAPVGGGMGDITCFLRDGNRVFLTYSTTGRGNEPVNGSLGLLDMTPYGRGEAWEENPEGWPEGGRPSWFWRSDADGNATWGPTSRPVPQWTRPGQTRPERRVSGHRPVPLQRVKRETTSRSQVQEPCPRRQS